MSSEITIKELAAVIWRDKWQIFITTMLATSVAAAYAILTPETYRSELLVQPSVYSKGPSGLDVFAGTLSEIGALGGLGFGQSGSDRAVALATLTSRTVVERFIEDFNLRPVLYSSDWNEEAKRWDVSDPEQIPSVWQAYNDFVDNVLRIAEDKKTGLVSVAVEWRNPEQAKEWATELVARTNAHLKNKAIEEGERNLAYLQKQARAIGQVELQQALYGLVEAELKKLMLASGNPEFALKTIDAAVVPQKRDWPKRSLIVAVGFLLGVFAAAALAIVRAGWADN